LLSSPRKLKQPPTARIEVRNRGESPIVVWVEPWAHDFTLFNNEQLEIVAFGVKEVPWFSVLETEGNTQVYCMGDANDFYVEQDGNRLEIGFQRQS
jgi:hypothetical protein